MALESLRAARPNLKSIIILLLHEIAVLFSWAANDFMILDPEEMIKTDAEGMRRLKYFLGGPSPDAANLIWCTKSGFKKVRLEDEILVEKPSPGLVAVLRTLLFGRFIFSKYTKAASILQRLFTPKFFVVDWNSAGYRNSTWRWLAASNKLGFPAVIKRWRTFPVLGDEVVLMGTGPSAGMIFEEPYRSMPLIACNTSLKPARLRQHRIGAFCVADALYFLAPHAYGAKFQEMLKEALMVQQFPVVVTGESYSFYRRRMPWIPDELLYPVLISGHYRPSTNMQRLPMLPNASSVFTVLMLPVAINFYKKIHLIGFDGKDPSLKNYFWKHSEEFQYLEELSTVREHDPGSFGNRRDDFYDNYNQMYSAQIDDLLALAVDKGCELRMAHPSFVPALKRLYEAHPGPGVNHLPRD